MFTLCTCLTESGIKRNGLTAALKSIGLERQFRAFGQNGRISWLVREPVADKVVGRLEYEGGRIAAQFGGVETCIRRFAIEACAETVERM